MLFRSHVLRPRRSQQGCALLLLRTPPRPAPTPLSAGLRTPASPHTSTSCAHAALSRAAHSCFSATHDIGATVTSRLHNGCPSAIIQSTLFALQWRGTFAERTFAAQWRDMLRSLSVLLTKMPGIASNIRKVQTKPFGRRYKERILLANCKYTRAIITHKLIDDFEMIAYY